METKTANHIIKKQVLEIQYPAEEDGRAFQQRMEKLTREVLLPIVEKICEEVSPNGSLHQIGRLDIDLGEIPFHQFGKRLKPAFEAQFRRELNAAMRKGYPSASAGPFAPRHSSTTEKGFEPVFPAPGFSGKSQLKPASAPGSDWQVFQYFMAAGLLPWWADAGNKQLVNDTAVRLIENAPGLLRQRFPQWWQRLPQRTRLITQLPDSTLILLAELFLPPDLSRDLTTGLKDITPRLSAFAQREATALSSFRMAFWTEVLFYLALPPLRVDHLGTKITGMLEALGDWGIRDITSKGKGANKKKELSEAEKFREKEGKAAPSVPSVSSSEEKRRIREETATEASLPPFPESMFGGSHLGCKRQLFEPHGGYFLGRSTAMPQKISLVRTKNLPFSLPKHHLQTYSDEAKPTMYSEQLLKEMDAFHDSDEIYISNSGLVILWPFLQQFFKAQGLIEERAFIDELCQFKAIFLLQALVEGHGEYPEFLLPLNKLLCGMPVSAAPALPGLLEETDHASCEDFLARVIASAPILNNMSVEGFRNTFLIREGMLKTHPQQWQLKVNRETYDLVLDRFPWPFNFVKLPWMEKLIAVEW